METTLKDGEAVELQLEDEEGRSYIGRINGSRIAQSDSFEVFLTDEGKVILYDGDQLKHWVVDDPEEGLRDNLDEGAYLDAMAAIGMTPTVDLEV